MKRTFFCILAVTLGLWASAQDKAKSGWSFTALPDLGYSTDLGLNLGLWGDVFDYGDGSLYPGYRHHFGFTGAYATKGSWYMHAFYDSEHLIPGVGVSLSATYRSASVNNFYGFNGIASPYIPEKDFNVDEGTAYYTNARRFIRAAALFNGKITGNLGWIGGAVFRCVWMREHTLDNYPSGLSLYKDYVDKGLIRADEAAGGTSLELKAGLRFDSRDITFAPTKGIFSELYVLSNSDLGGTNYHYGQLVADFRHYLTLLPQRIIFAYHLALQHQLWGEIPYYNINELATPEYRYEEFSGLGSRYSIRGYRYNRISAAGYAWGNFELRCIPFIFNLFNQYFEIVVTPFSDLGVITKKYRLEEQKALGPAFYQDIKLPVMASAGIGLKLQMNHNFILSVDFAKGFHPQLNDFMVGMASSYVF